MRTGPPLLELQELRKAFGGVHAVRDLSFTVQEGEILGMIGPNGSGKTTTFNLITGFFPPDAGRVVLAGENITGRPPYDICRRGVCRTFQLAKPFHDLTVLRNVTIGSFLGTRDPQEAEARAWTWLAYVGLEGKARVLAKSLTTIDQRRLELARALATEPRLLLLDETMAGLTPHEVVEAVALIEKIRREGRTLIVVEHVMRAIMAISDRIIVLDHGSKIAEGKPEQVVADPHVIRAYLGEGYRRA